MKRKRFTEEQIIGVLKEHDLGAKTADLCRKHGHLLKMEEQIPRYGRVRTRRLKQLPDENGKLKKLLAEQGSATAGGRRPSG
jgi:putative transposase